MSMKLKCCANVSFFSVDGIILNLQGLAYACAKKTCCMFQLFVELRQREQDRERQKRDWEMKERQREESRLREEEGLRRQQDEMQHRLRQQEEEMRRRQQENSMFMAEQNTDPSPVDFRRSLQPPPIFDRPLGIGANGGPHALMDLPMVRLVPFIRFRS